MEGVENTEKLMKLALQFDLAGNEVFDQFTVYEIHKIWNGIGPEWLPSILRNMVSKLHPSLEPVALIHDLQWSLSCKSVEHFTKTNDEFKENGKRIAFGLYGWYNPRRYLVWNQGYRFGRLCHAFGWNAYLAGKPK